MKQKGIKSLGIREETHRKIEVESTAARKKMYAVVDDMWAAYEGAKVGAATAAAQPSRPSKVLHIGTIEEELALKILRWIKSPKKNTASQALAEAVIKVVEVEKVQS